MKLRYPRLSECCFKVILGLSPGSHFVGRPQGRVRPKLTPGDLGVRPGWQLETRLFCGKGENRDNGHMGDSSTDGC